jgi:hypothetical protein
MALSGHRRVFTSKCSVGGTERIEAQRIAQPAHQRRATRTGSASHRRRLVSSSPLLRNFASGAPCAQRRP